MGAEPGRGAGRDGAAERASPPRTPRHAWVWPAATAAVAAVVIAVIVVLAAVQRGHQDAAASAQEAELAASRVNAAEWQSIATGHVVAGVGAQIARLRSEVGSQLAHQHPGIRIPALRSALSAYTSAIGEEFRLISEGQIARARQVDEERVDPAYRTLDAELRTVAAADARAARSTQVAVAASGIATIVIGLAAVAFFAFRFATTRRELVAAQAEQRVLAETSQAKSDLISVVSHDLRTPLTAILGYLEVLREGEAGPVAAGHQPILDVIQRNANRLLAIVNDLLFISRAQEHGIALTLRTLSLAEVAGEAVEAQRLRARAREVDLSLAAKPTPEVMADRARVDEIIENLLSNAIKFTPSGGSVQVRVAPAGEAVRVEVADTGMGISAADQEHIFERFFRSPTVMGLPGTGLGLAIVKAIADAHGASVGVRSALGEGSAFRVDFPVSRPSG